MDYCSEHLISIIVPVYNSSLYLPCCIESILKQTYSNFELILVNDGSKDNSLEICNKYALQDSRIVVVDQQNAGPSAARNHGIEVAKGDFVTFVDSDDWVDPDYLSSYHPEDLTEDFDISFSGLLQEEENGSLVKWDVPSLSAKGKEALSQFILMIHKQSMLGWVCNKLYKTSIIKSHELKYPLDVNIREDEIFTLDYLAHVKGAISIPGTKYHYRVHGNSLMGKEKEYISYQKIAKCVLDKFIVLSNGNAEFLQYVHQSYFQEYMVGIGAIRTDNRYNHDQKFKFLRDCKNFIVTHKDIDLQYTDGKMQNLIKKLLFNYFPVSILYRVVF